MSPPTRTPSVMIVLGLAVTVITSAVAMWQAATGFLIDLAVFQDAGKALLAGDDLYSEHFPTRSGLRFIYPPFAAVLFTPLALGGQAVVQVLWTLATILAIGAILAMVATRLHLARPHLIAAALTGVALLFEPIRSNLGFGQINIFLFLLITADVLGFTPRRFRGVLLGVAAGIKITPAAFGVLFLVRGDWAALARSVATVAATILIGLMVRTQESVYFWTHEFFVTDRGGSADFIRNQAVSGWLARAGVTDPALSIATMALFILAAAVAIWGAWRLTRRHRPVEAFALVSLAVFVASPVAVTHHWSGVIIALPLLLATRPPLLRASLVALILAHLIGVHQYADLTAHTGWTAAGHWLLGNTQGVTGLLVMVVLLALPRPPAIPRHSSPAELVSVAR